MAMNPYPTERELLNIELWDLIEGDNGRHDKLYSFIKYISDIWYYPDRVFLGKARKHKWMKGKRIRTFYLSTGGWSGNEDVIESMRKNFIFWSMFWNKSQKGGHYWFDIPPRIEKVKAKSPLSQRVGS